MNIIKIEQPDLPNEAGVELFRVVTTIRKGLETATVSIGEWFDERGTLDAWVDASNAQYPELHHRVQVGRFHQNRIPVTEVLHNAQD